MSLMEIFGGNEPVCEAKKRSAYQGVKNNYF